MSSAADERAEALLAQMTLEEKLAYIGGDRSFYIRPVERLGIPEIKMSDGPVGCRNWGASTAYPATVALAATFDPGLAERMGTAIGRDCRARGVHILLGPGVNLHRSPLTGRNFEYLGEDPLLAGEMAAAYIRGVQSEGVLATVKHLAANNQEWDRNNISSEVDERTLREIYLPAFERAVKAGGAGAVMTAYNLLNGTYCSHHEWLLKRVLKGEWGFDGFVMSDWGAVHDGAAAAAGGCDLEMPRGRHMNAETLRPLIEAGTLDAAVIDEKVRRILRTLIAAGFLERPQAMEEIPLDDPSSRETALAVAREGLVLLKNTGDLLPLDRTGVRRIALIGPGVHPAVTGGAGSSYVTPNRTLSLRDAMARVAPDIETSYHPGIQQLDDPSAVTAAEQAVTAAAEIADAVVVAVGFGQSADTNTAAAAYAPNWPEGFALAAGMVEAEGHDRPFALPEAQVRTIALARAANPATVVIVTAGGAVDLTGFLEEIPALIYAWYPGQEGTLAAAEILFGEIAPSGRLPVTLPLRYDDTPSAPYYHLSDDQQTPYTEGVFVGYRGFDAAGIEPAFPFGHGLGYTTFAYENLETAIRDDGSVEVTVAVTNSGRTSGDEVVQVYIGPAFSTSVPRPPKILAGFTRVFLAARETRTVSLIVEARAFAFWDVSSGDWRIEAGGYDILVGASSRDIRLTKTVEVPEGAPPMLQ